MMEDYDRTLELVSVTEDAKGRADEQFAKNAESLQFKLQSLKTAWEQLRLSFANSDFFKGIVDMMTKFVNILGKMDKTQMATVATIGIVMGKTIITNLLDTIKQGASQIQTTLQQISDVSFWKRNPLQPFKAVFNRPFDSEKYIEGSHATLGNALGVSLGFDPSKISAENLTSLEQQITKVAQLNQSYQQQWNTIKQIEAAGGTITDKQETQFQLTNQQLLAAKDLANAKAKELGYEQKITQENSKQISQDLQSVRQNSTSTSMGGQLIKRGLQSGLQASITTALMTALSGADFSTVIKTALTTALMAALPSVITAISEPLITALTGPVGLIALIVIAIGVGVANIIKKQNEVRDAELERLGSVKKLNKELQDQAEELINENKKNQEEAKKLRKYREDIEKYQNKNPEFLTDEEQKRLTEAQDYIKDNYEDAFRETWDGKFELIEKKLDQIILKMDNDGAPGKLLANINQQTKNLNDRAEELERYQNVISGKGGFSKDNFQRIGTNWDLLFDRNFKDTAKMAQGYLIDGENAIDVGTQQQILDNIERLYGEEIPQEYSELFDNFTGTQEEINQIVSLIEDLKTIEAAQLDETQRQGVQDILELQDWDKGAAEIASYLGAEIKENGNEEFAKAIEHDLVETLSSGQYSKLGANEETVLTALNSLGIESPQDLFDSGSNLKKWDDLAKESKDFVAALESMGITKDTWDNGNAWLAIAQPGFIGAEIGSSLSGQDSIIRAGRKDANMENRVLSQIIAAQTLKSDELFIKEYQEVFEKNQEIITAYAAEELNYAGKTFAEFSSNLSAIYNNADEDVQEAMDAYDKAHEDSIKGQWERYNNILETSDIDEETIEQLSFNSAQNIQSLIMSVSSASRDQIVEYLNGLGEHLSTKDWEILGNLNLKDLSSLGIDGAQTYIDQLIAAGHSAEEAQKIFNDYIQKMSRFTLQGLYFGTNSTNILHENIKEKISGLPEQFESITKAQKEMMENGSIVQETYLKLREDGMDEYVTYTSNGYELISDKAQEFFVKQAMSSKEFVSQEIKNQKEYMNELSEISKREEEGINSHIQHLLTLKPEEVEGQLETYRAFLGAGMAATIEAIYKAGAKNLTEYKNLIKEGIQALTEEEKQAYLDGLIAINEQYKEAADNVEKLKDDLDELNKTLEKNKEALDEAEQKYQEAIHGSQYFTSSLDPLLNYDNTLKSINNDLDDLKESFEDIDSIEDGVDILNDLADNYDKKSAALSSENVVYGNAMANLRASMEDRFGNYVKFNGDDLFVDYSYTQMDANDAIRKALEDSINTYNNYKEKRQSNDKELRKLDKERQQFEKDALKEYVDLQKEVIDVLKSQAEEEVTVTKDKYDALKEADNEYIDALEEAIQKQRDLRNKENEEEELAQKEKRLSLMRRDTSGTNAKEIQSLEQEIESDREKLLDNSIDSIVNNMKELYEKQAEARDAEIEYMEAVTENAQYFSDWAASIMASWNSQEDMQAWFLDNDKAIEDMTVEQQELYISDLKEKWTDLVTYQSTQLVDVNANMDNINQTMNNLLTDLDENATTKGQEIITIAQHTADEAVKSAEKARDSAKEAIEETEKKIVELNKNMATATEIAQLTHGAAMNAMKDASQEAMKETSVYAVKVLADFLGVDLKDETATKAFAEKNDLVNTRGEYSQSLLDAIWQAGGSTKNFKSTESWMMYLPGTGSSQETVLSRGYATQAEAEAAARAYGSNAKVRLDVTSGKYGDISDLEYNANPISFSNPSSKSVAKQQFSIKDYLTRTPIYPGQNGNAIITFADGTWGYLSEDALEKVGYNIYSLLNYPDIADVSWGWDQGKATYKKGGLVKHTGPAWVDGTPSRPEAFLTAEDTERFSLAAELFATSPLLNSKMAQNNVSSSIGDTSIEININVESISDDYDVDRLIQRVEDDINETARPIGTQVILNKRV